MKKTKQIPINNQPAAKNKYMIKPGKQPRKLRAQLTQVELDQKDLLARIAVDDVTITAWKVSWASNAARKAAHGSTKNKQRYRPGMKALIEIRYIIKKTVDP